jgi:hypothetical protein
MVTVWLGVPLAGCRSMNEPDASWPEAAKIRFPMDDIRPDGLRGPPDGLVSVAFEFCVPTDDGVYGELLTIDPGLAIWPATRGRIGCLPVQSLVIGETAQPGWRDVLKALSKLDYVEEIRECYFE